MKILLSGASGIVGSELLQILLIDNTVEQIISLGRKKIDFQHPKLQQYICNFENIEQIIELQNLPTNAIDFAFCCLGTTLAAAKSRENFYRVDFNYVLHFARFAKEKGVHTFGVISSMGAKDNAYVYYNRVKGEMEKAISQINFDQIKIFRPSLLMAEHRKENRIGERMAIFIFRYLNPFFSKTYQGIRPLEVAHAIWKYAQEKTKERVKIISNKAMKT